MTELPGTALPSDRLRGLYEARAEQQYARVSPLPDPRLDRKFERISNCVQDRRPVGAFLDAGCGDGRYLAMLPAGSTTRRVGVDISSRILETARSQCDAELYQANLERLPFAEAEFDLVLCSQVIEHVVDASAAVGELARVLRPGGTLILSTDNRRNLVTKALNLPRTAGTRVLRQRGRRGLIESPAHAYTQDELRELLGSSSFEITHLETFRFHVMWPLDWPPLTRALNALDSRLPPHGLGDILLAVARRP